MSSLALNALDKNTFINSLYEIEGAMAGDITAFKALITELTDLNGQIQSRQGDDDEYLQLLGRVQQVEFAITNFIGIYFQRMDYISQERFLFLDPDDEFDKEMVAYSEQLIEKLQYQINAMDELQRGVLSQPQD